jgi:hypothetical protein
MKTKPYGATMAKKIPLSPFSLMAHAALLALLNSGCVKAPSVTAPPERRLYEPKVPTLQETGVLKGSSSVTDLMVLVFPAHDDSRRWSGVFEKAFAMRDLQSQARTISQQRDVDFEKLSGIFDKISALATDLYENDTVYFLTLSSLAGCQVAEMQLTCSPEFDELPDAPTYEKKVEITEMSRNGRKVAEAMTITLKSRKPGDYSLRLVLAPESHSPDALVNESLWSGTVQVLPNSHFPKGKAHPFGYAEMRLQRL